MFPMAFLSPNSTSGLIQSREVLPARHFHVHPSPESLPVGGFSITLYTSLLNRLPQVL